MDPLAFVGRRRSRLFYGQPFWFQIEALCRFVGQPHLRLTYSYLGQPVLSKKNEPPIRKLSTFNCPAKNPVHRLTSKKCNTWYPVLLKFGFTQAELNVQ